VEAPRLRALRHLLAERLRATVRDLVVNGDSADGAPHVLSVSVAGADSEALLMHLDLAGVAASSGSACSTGAVEPSHVLVAMGVPRELALGAIRFSFGRESSAEDVDRVVEVMPAVVAKVRQLAGVLGRAAS
jgi:cysteine desulfurase